MKKVGGAGAVTSHGGILWLVLGLALIAAPQARAACDCSNTPNSFAWLANSKVRFNNEAVIMGNVGANLPGGMIRFGQRSCQDIDGALPCNGAGIAVYADRITVGQDTSIAGSRSNRLKLGPGAIVRNPPLLNVTLPLVSADPALVCGAFAPVSCGGPDVNVPWYGNAVIPPGSYNNLTVGNGATITLGAGIYNFCNVKIGSDVTGNVSDAVVLNVDSKFSMGSGTALETNTTTPFVLNVEGSLVRLSQAATLEAEVRAPFGKIRMQRRSEILGCSCSDTITCDKGHVNICEGGGSPSGAFLD